MYSAIQTSVNVCQYQIIFWVVPLLNFFDTRTQTVNYILVLTFFSATTAESAIAVAMPIHSRSNTILLCKNPLVIRGSCCYIIIIIIIIRFRSAQGGFYYYFIHTPPSRCIRSLGPRWL